MSDGQMVTAAGAGGYCFDHYLAQNMCSNGEGSLDQQEGCGSDKLMVPPLVPQLGCQAQENRQAGGLMVAGFGGPSTLGRMRRTPATHAGDPSMMMMSPLQSTTEPAASSSSSHFLPASNLHCKEPEFFKGM